MICIQFKKRAINRDVLQKTYRKNDVIKKRNNCAREKK